MVALSAGMVVFFLLASWLTRMLGQGARAARGMLVAAGVFGLLLVASLVGG
jgi:hypothetical protein